MILGWSNEMGKKRKLLNCTVTFALVFGIYFFYDDDKQLSADVYAPLNISTRNYIQRATYINGVPQLSNDLQKTLKAKLGRAKSDKKYILRWYGGKSKQNPWPNETCGRCEMTTDRSLINVKETGAVVFLYNKINRDTMPPLKTRRKDQLHVWYTAEAPASLYNMRKLSLIYEDEYEFNVTQTYRRDSDIYHPYGDMEEILQRKNGFQDFKQILANKTMLSIAVVSNCNSSAGAIVRMDILQRIIEAGMNVQTYGRCFGKETIPKTEPHEFEAYLNRYKFYFAFENSYHCRDYITEKFFINGFRSGTVPVAWGGTRKDYEAVVPHDSFIFAEDFKTVNDLVDYLNYLDKNDTAYLQYFQWYKRGTSGLPSIGRAIRFCQLCRQIHGINVDDIYNQNLNASHPAIPLFTENIAYRRVSSLREWYYGTEMNDCYVRKPEDIKAMSSFNYS